jgi:predicted ATPase/DNA-binding NarL/FixJ family response regulator
MDLTRREREVSALVAQGLTNRAIAKRLFLSERTIEGHIEHVFNKLGVTSRTQLAMAIGAAEGVARNNSETASSLPVQLTSFVGRQKEIEALRTLLSDQRIVTLTGIGGSGKTRLALELARRIQQEDKALAWLVDLSAITDPALLVQTAATTLGIQVRDSGDEGLVDRMRKAKGLIVFDNCEHVAPACARLLNALASQCPDLQFLSTSREPLRVVGEKVWRVQPLSLPAKGATLREMGEAEAVALFVDRAQSIDSRFEVNKSNFDSIAEVCRRLDGLPLAIELAAALVGLLSPSQIAAKLDDRFALLAAETPNSPDRQRTLKATLQWSYELLPESERCVFRRLAIFNGTFNLEAAEAVVGTDPIEPRAVLECMGRLIDKSLVSPAGVSRDEARYRLLESTRVFALELLSARSEALQIAERHARLYASIALEAGNRLGGPDASDWTELVADEMDNLRTALAWCITNDSRLALAVCASLGGYWDFHGWLYEGRHWLDRVIAADDGIPTSERASALAAAGMLAFRLADYMTARRRFEACLADAEAIGDRALSARALAGLGDVSVHTGDPDSALAMFESSIALYRLEGDVLSVARGLSRLAGTYNVREDFASAEKLFQQSLDAFRQLGDRVGVANQLFTIGSVRMFMKNYQSARNYLAESLKERRETGDTVGIAWSCTWLACSEVLLGNLLAACKPLVEGLKGCEAVGDVRGVSMALDMVLGLFLAAGLPRLGLRVEAAALRIRADGGFDGMPPFSPTLAGWVTEARSKLPLDDAEHDEMAGASMSAKEAVEFAIDQIRALEAHLRKQPESPLTRREHEMAALVAEGLTNRDIAERMHISERTVDSHVQHVIAKLGFRSRAQVAAWHALNSQTGISRLRDRATPRTGDRYVAAILVLDIVESTVKLSELGDSAWRHLLEDHYRLARHELDRHNGVEIDIAGDGLLATFDGPALAIKCAWAIQRADRGLGLMSRAGVHCGEVERAGHAIRGIAVHIVVRLASLGHADEVMVSGTAQELAAGSGIRFEDRGLHTLKGVPHPRQVFAASNRV